MAHALQHHHLDFADYLIGERDINSRSEYFNGHVYAMAGASETHNTIASAFFLALGNHLNDACRIWQSDMKVIGENNGKHFAYYPDIMAACGENTGDQYSRTNPILIVEVLSPGTQRIDFGEKLDNYASISSLIEYVIVSQDTPFVVMHRRRTHWQAEAHYADDELTVESIDLTLPVQQIYRQVRREVGLL